MSLRNSKARRTALAALAAPIAIGAAVVAPAQTAEAHGSISNTYEWRKTSSCSCQLSDEYDGTVFRHDKGGEAAKARIYSHEKLVGKMEFHPYDEKFWIYDTKANNDAIWYRISWSGHDWVGKVQSGHADAIDLNISEGTKVKIQAFDDIADSGVPYDLLSESHGTA